MPPKRTRAGRDHTLGPEPCQMKHTPEPTMSTPDPARETFGIGTLARASLGGALMGLANLVPGISGGTMLVASGIYQRFITAISDVTRLRLKPPSLLVLGTVVMAAGLAIVLLAGTISSLLVSHRWAMYAIFIGLTWGGAPLLVRMLRPFTPAAWIGVVCGAIAMAGLSLAQSAGAAGSGQSGFLLLLFAGIAGASAMILPGVSGAYLLLLLGQYRPILESIDRLKDAASARSISLAWAEAPVLAPVGIGVVVGVVGVSNLLKMLLERAPKPTIGVLLGLLLAAPIGLYPFKEGVPPAVGETFDGAVVTEESLAEIDPRDWPERAFAPSGGQIAGAAGLILLGFGLTMGLASIGNRPSRPETKAEPPASAE